jgi:glycosyltransferase involved in cell wall biosynthesis
VGEAAALCGVRVFAAGAQAVFPVTALRVVFVIPAGRQGNSMIFARRQAEGMRRQGVEVWTYFLRSRTSLLSLVREFGRFRRELRRHRPQVVHAHFGTMTALFAGFAAGRLPLVITYRGSDLNDAPGRTSLRAGLGLLLSQLAALRAARMVCVSEALRRRLWWRRGRVTVLATGVDPQEFRPEPKSAARQRLGWNDAERVVLFNAGSDPRVKRWDLARAAVAEAQRAVPQLRCEVMDGEVPPGLVPTLMNGADCLLVTSDREGSPAVILEAIACGLPVVSVDVGDAAERLRGVRHSCIAPRDARALGAALAGMVTPPRRTDGPLRVGEFSAAAVAARLRGIYEELTGERS